MLEIPSSTRRAPPSRRRLRGRTALVQQRFLPLPWHVVAALCSMLVERSFLDDIAISVTRSWARELAPDILVNAVAPGPADTPASGCIL